MNKNLEVEQYSLEEYCRINNLKSENEAYSINSDGIVVITSNKYNIYTGVKISDRFISPDLEYAERFYGEYCKI